jgi:DNA mismatch repair protein MutS2
MINEHSLKTLEYYKIIELIKGKTLTPYGSELIDRIQPLFDKEMINNKLSKISELKDILNFGLPFPLYRSDDIRDLLTRSTVEDIFIEAKDILSIVNFITVSIDLNRYDKESRDKFPLISEILKEIRSFPELRIEIIKTIDEDGSIKDNASKKLKSVRRDLAESKQKITSQLQQILNKQGKTPGWQDDIVTIRNGRYVIGVPTNKFKSDLGILHDRSQTGSTLFIEPKATVELNNRINMLYQEEQEEIIRLLKSLTNEIGARAEPLLNNTRLIGELDSIHACAKFSIRINGEQPIIVDSPQFNLIDANHPLLLLQFEDKSKVIPNSISLDDNRQAILITGPNTGGKTILLKTIGLSILMAQSGLHIPANEKSEVGIFEDIYADIGDEQSIELSLSTFSSHVTNIIDGLTKADKSVLLLYDEIGAGTDPKEGSALAEAIILKGLKKKARMIVTTHYSQLKTLAMDYPNLENGSLEFDKESLAPTFKLKLGIPGSSYAVEIARRLGMPEDICNHASSLLSSEEKSLDKLISSLEDELKIIKEDKIKLTEKLEKATEQEKLYRERNEHLTNETTAEKEKMLKETKKYLEQTRRDIEHLVAEIRKSNASDKAVKEFHRKLKSAEKKVLQSIPEEKLSLVDQTSFNKGDYVEIISLNQTGEIEELVGEDKAKIKIGNLFTSVEIRQLRKLDKQKSNNKTQTKFSYTESENINREIHLRGFTAEEALERLEKFLDQAIIAGLNQVYVIHGKGTGALRRSLTDYLKNHMEVASIRLGDFNEGGAGVTVVKLKD